MLQRKESGSLLSLTIATIALSLVASAAGAQVNPETGDVGAGAQASGNFKGSASAVTAQPVATAEPAANVGAATPTDPALAGPTDHSGVVGSWGVGFFGITNVPICTNPADCVTGDPTLAAPTIGVRYWLKDTMAIEGAVGFYNRSGGGEIKPAVGVTPRTYDDASLTAFALHGGLPIALADSQHFTFEVIPELNFGIAGGSRRGATSADDESYSGFLFQLGGRIGAEVHFGFMGLPKLSLVGTLGLFLTADHRSAERSGGTPSYSHNTFTLGTTVGGKPWDIFTSNIAAIYYF